MEGLPVDGAKRCFIRVLLAAIGARFHKAEWSPVNFIARRRGGLEGSNPKAALRFCI